MHEEKGNFRDIYPISLPGEPEIGEEIPGGKHRETSDTEREGRKKKRQPSA